MRSAGASAQNTADSPGDGEGRRSEPRAEAFANFLAKIRLSYSLYHNNTDTNEEFFIVQNSHPKKASSQNNSFA